MKLKKLLNILDDDAEIEVEGVEPMGECVSWVRACESCSHHTEDYGCDLYADSYRAVELYAGEAGLLPLKLGERKIVRATNRRLIGEGVRPLEIVVE